MPDVAVVLMDGELLHDYAFRVTRERDEARAEASDLRAALESANESQQHAVDAALDAIRERDEARALLQEVEGDLPVCPICGEWLQQSGYVGQHAPDCRLAAALEGRDG